MDKVYALYHADCTMPLGMYEAEWLAFEAIDTYAAQIHAPKNEFTVVSFNVNKVGA